MCLTPEPGRSPGGGNGNPFQYSCLGNAVDRGAWGVTIHGVTKSQTRLRTHTLFLHNRECKKVKRERESVSHSVVSNSL